MTGLSKDAVDDMPHFLRLYALISVSNPSVSYTEVNMCGMWWYSKEQKIKKKLWCLKLSTDMMSLTSDSKNTSPQYTVVMCSPH